MSAERVKARNAELAAEALEVVEEICDRADAMGLGLVKFMVSDVRRVVALARQVGAQEKALKDNAILFEEIVENAGFTRAEFVGQGPALLISRLEVVATLARAAMPPAGSVAMSGPALRGASTETEGH